MPIQDHYKIPASVQDLPVPDTPDARLYIAFISGTDPVTKQPWCPDVRAALPRLKKAFAGAEAPKLLYVHVGQRPEWKDLANVYRKKWDVKAVPQLVRYQRIGGEVKATGTLVENDVNDDAKLQGFLAA